MDLKGKRVLFIGPSFYNYHNEIINELSLFGADVDYFPEILNTMRYRFSKQYLKRYCIKLEKNYLEDIFKKLRDDYDYFFLIRGEIITTSFLERLKQKIPKATFIMYQWDSYKNNPNYLKILSYFSKVMTFDMLDAKEKDIKYLPLFYIKRYGSLKLDVNKEYDIVFFGAYHSDRLHIVKKIHRECLEHNLKFYSVIYITKMAFILRLLKNQLKFSDYKYLTFQAVNDETILSIYKKTKAVLDIESIGQEGLTIRTFEVLGASIKLLTTNKNIKDEPFYNCKNILLLRREKIEEINYDFFISKNSKENFFKEYSLSQWIKKIFI